MKFTRDILNLLDEVLSLQGRSATFTDETPLLGALPELDSLAVVDLLSALEQRFGLQLMDDEIDGHSFATVGSLALLIEDKLARQPAA